MHKVTVKKQILGAIDIILVRYFDLEFIPFIGLTLLEGATWSATIEQIHYSIDNKEWICYDTPDKELYFAYKHDAIKRRSVNEIVADHIEKGWVLG